MKIQKLLLGLIILLCFQMGFAQQGINYKALIKDDLGNVLASQTIDVKFTIIADAGPTDVYTEIHPDVETDANGIIVLNIGEGNTSNVFADINWSSDTHSLKTEIDTEQDGTFEFMSTTQFMAVPYALNAGATSIDGLTDGKSDNDGTNNGSSLFLGIGAGASDDGANNGNVGVGYQALTANTTGYFNTANGFRVLFSNTTGTYNTANSYKALESNTTGSYNTANGALALRFNTTGDGNTAYGYNALRNINTGSGNVALGYRAGYFESGSNKLYIANSDTNTPLIYGEFDTESLTLNGRTTINSNSDGLVVNSGNGPFDDGLLIVSASSDGVDVMAAGRMGVRVTSADISGVFVQSAGNNGVEVISAGNNGGFFKGVTSGVYAASSNNANPDIILGGTANTTTGDDGIIASNPAYAGSDIFLRSNDAVVVQLDFNNDETGEFEIKNGAGTEVFEVRESGNATLAGSLTQSSDRRLKKDIETLPYGLKEILQLQPKAYNWKNRTQTQKSLGLIAQDVQPLIKEIVTAQDDEAKTLGISYTELIPVLINAIQEQQAIIDQQNLKINALESLDKRIEQLEALQITLKQ